MNMPHPWSMWYDNPSAGIANYIRQLMGLRYHWAVRCRTADRDNDD